MSTCPDCDREVAPGTYRCHCGALLGTVARKPDPPKQESAPTGGPSPEAAAKIKGFLRSGFPEPSREWARKLLERELAGEQLSWCQMTYAHAVMTEGLETNAREPGCDDE